MKKITNILIVLLGTLLCASCAKEPGTALQLSQDEFLDIDFAGTEKSLQITTEATWSIGGNPAWITVDPATGTGNATVALTIAPNDSENGRSATLEVKAGGTVRQLLVTQLGLSGDRLLISDSGFRTWLAGMGYIAIIDDERGEIVLTDKGAKTKELRPSHPSASNPIRSLEGIEFFTEIELLDARLGTLTELDLSGNTKLKTVYTTGNMGLTALDVSMLPDLETLQAAESGTMALDVTHNPELRYLSINYNPIIELDVTRNTKLQQLYASTCRRYQTPGDISTPVVSSISELDVSNCPDLIDLQCGANPFLTEIDVTHNPKLVELHTFGCGITELDTSNNPELESLWAFFTPTLARVDVTGNPKLKWFYIDETAITEIDLSGNPVLGEFRCCDMAITELDLSHNPELITLTAYGSQLTELDLSHNTRLVKLNLSRTPLTELDISMLPELVELVLFGSKITTVDLTTNPKIVGFGWTMAEGLTGETLNISGCRDLQLLQILTGQDNAIPGDDTLYLGDTPGEGAIYANIRHIIADDTRLAGKLNVTGNPVLETLSMQHNELGEALLTGNGNLHRLYLYDTDAAGVPTRITQSGNAADFQVVTSPRP